MGEATSRLSADSCRSGPARWDAAVNGDGNFALSGHIGQNGQLV
jgi:hypothetical protein